MVSYEFLDKMFRRLSEARSHLAYHDDRVRKFDLPKTASKADMRKLMSDQNAERNMLLGTVIAIEYSIRDYIEHHGGNNG